MKLLCQVEFSLYYTIFEFLIVTMGKGGFEPWMSLFKSPRSSSWVIRLLALHNFSMVRVGQKNMKSHIKTYNQKLIDVC